MKLKTIAFLILLLGSQWMHAQVFEHTIEIGPTIGSSFYLGEANQTLFKNSQFAFGGVIRYPLNTRFALSLEALTGSFYGQFKDANLKTCEFKNSFFFTSAHVEFNFFSYDQYNLALESSTINPYILGGLGIVSYQSSGTPVLTGGLGIKFKLNKRWDLNCQWTLNKAFADNLEGAPQLNNPYELNKSSFLNNDYFSVFSVSITFAFYTQRCPCRTGILQGL
ncbi:MAG: DUF6089 family protein [Microbacter sp.]